MAKKHYDKIWILKKGQRSETPVIELNLFFSTSIPEIPPISIIDDQSLMINYWWSSINYQWPIEPSSMINRLSLMINQESSNRWLIWGLIVSLAAWPVRLVHNQCKILSKKDRFPSTVWIIVKSFRNFLHLPIVHHNKQAT